MMSLAVTPLPAAAFKTRRVRSSVSTRCVAATTSGSKKGSVYVGKGKFVNDDPNKYPGRTPDNLAGGWAGGEAGLWQFREELVVKGPPKAEKAAKKGSGKSSNVNLDKDFGSMAGGFPGGEVGLKIFNATGEVPKTQPATIGPIGGTLGILLPTYAAVTLITGEPDPRVLLSALSEVAPSAEQVAGAGSGVKINLPPVDPAAVIPAAPYIALGSGVVAGGLAVRALASTVLDVASRSARVAAVGAVAVAVAGKILNIW